MSQILCELNINTLFQVFQTLTRHMSDLTWRSHHIKDDFSSIRRIKHYSISPFNTSLGICYIVEYDLHCTSSFSPTDVKGDTANNPIKQLRISDIKRCSYPKFLACVVKYSYYSIQIEIADIKILFIKYLENVVVYCKL